MLRLRRVGFARDRARARRVSLAAAAPRAHRRRHHTPARRRAGARSARVALPVGLGPKRLPELSKGLGQAIRGFKQALHEEPDSGAKKSVGKEKE